ncbi:MAG: carboxypeptidase-like regulatory domain-containing protein, partial [Bacteroidales bacterium]
MKHFLRKRKGSVKGMLMFLALLFVSFSLLNAQVTVTGTVTSAEDGMSIPGVNIVQKGTAHGSITDADGNYSLDVPSDATLVFSFIGMETIEVEVGGRTIVDVAMNASTTQLDEVVVTGYGTASRATLTGAVAAVKGDELKQSPTTNFSNTLVGKV